MDIQSCINCYVSGRVQGVWYRAHAREEALRLGLTGFARNLADGRVEVLACGAPEQLALFCIWLKKGPPLAEVSELSCEEQPWRQYEGFSVL